MKNLIEPTNSFNLIFFNISTVHLPIWHFKVEAMLMWPCHVNSFIFVKKNNYFFGRQRCYWIYPGWLQNPAPLNFSRNIRVVYRTKMICERDIVLFEDFRNASDYAPTSTFPSSHRGSSKSTIGPIEGLYYFSPCTVRIYPITPPPLPEHGNILGFQVANTQSTTLFRCKNFIPRYPRYFPSFQITSPEESHFDPLKSVDHLDGCSKHGEIERS